MSGGGITLGGGGSGGVVAGGVWFPTESGLQAPGGLFDRLTQAMDARAQYEGTLRGYGPALRDAGVPVPAASPSMLGQLLGTLGLGATQPAPAPAQMPNLSAPIGGGGGAPAPTMSDGAPTQGSTSGTPQGQLGGNALASYIGQGAQKRGIDPMTALRVVQSEGGFAPATAGDAGSSFGPFQLHYASGTSGPNASPGMGDDFTRATGLDARDPRNATAAIDYALDRAAKEGWGAFHGAARAGIGQWDGIGGAPTRATAYAPADSSDASSIRAPLPARANGGPMMPQASASRPQPSQAFVEATSNGPGGSGAPAQGATASPSAVIGPLMSNPQTRGAGAQAWQMFRQAASNGGAQGALTLPGGMSAQDLAAMIAEPATQATGLAIWQKSLFPQITSIEPNRAVFRGTQYIGQTPAEPKMEVTRTGTDDYGQPTYSTLNTHTGATAPIQGAPNAGAPAGGANGQPLSGDDFLKTLPGPLASQVKAIAEGRMKMPPVSSRSPIAARLPSMVLSYRPDYDQSTSDARFDTRKNFTDGDAAKAINSGNTAIQHAADLSDAAEALGNGNYPVVNKLLQAYGSATGGNVPGKEFQGALNDFTDEVVRFYRNSGGTEADINAVKASLDPSQSPDQLRAGIQQQARLMAGKTNAFQNQWHIGMGASEPDFPIFSKETQAALGRINARSPSVSSYPPRDAGAGASGAQAPLPVASPAGSIPTITDPAQAQALPPGSRFRGPDGQLRVRH